MKKFLLALLSLTAASFVFAGDSKSSDQDKAKCADKSDKACCCCCKEAKACTDAKDAKCDDTQKDAKAAEAPAKK